MCRAILATGSLGREGRRETKLGLQKVRGGPQACATDWQTVNTHCHGGQAGGAPGPPGACQTSLALPRHHDSRLRMFTGTVTGKDFGTDLSRYRCGKFDLTLRLLQRPV